MSEEKFLENCLSPSHRSPGGSIMATKPGDILSPLGPTPQPETFRAQKILKTCPYMFGWSWSFQSSCAPKPVCRTRNGFALARSMAFPPPGLMLLKNMHASASSGRWLAWAGGAAAAAHDAGGASAVFEPPLSAPLRWMLTIDSERTPLDCSVAASRSSLVPQRSSSSSPSGQLPCSSPLSASTVCDSRTHTTRCGPLSGRMKICRS